MSIIGDNIKALRMREGLTQQELAEAIHVSRETVNKWESGVIEALRERNVQAICSLFDLADDDLKSETRGLSAQIKSTGLSRAAMPREGEDQRGAQPTLHGEAVWQRHPRAFAIEMDSSMSRVLPPGSLAIVDPEATPSSGSIVAADIPIEGGSVLVVRRMQRGSTKTLLSAESYEGGIDDLVIENDELSVRGTVVWYQPSSELS